MTVVELTDIKTTINWLLENGEFKDAETSYNIAMNSINILEEALTIHSVVSSNFICNSENRRKEKCKEQCAWCDGFN